HVAFRLLGHLDRGRGHGGQNLRLNLGGLGRVTRDQGFVGLGHLRLDFLGGQRLGTLGLGLGAAQLGQRLLSLLGALLGQTLLAQGLIQTRLRDARFLLGLYRLVFLSSLFWFRVSLVRFSLFRFSAVVAVPGFIHSIPSSTISITGSISGITSRLASRRVQVRIIVHLRAVAEIQSFGQGVLGLVAACVKVQFVFVHRFSRGYLRGVLLSRLAARRAASIGTSPWKRAVASWDAVRSCSLCARDWWVSWASMMRVCNSSRLRVICDSRRSRSSCWSAEATPPAICSALAALRAAPLRRFSAWASSFCTSSATASQSAKFEWRMMIGLESTSAYNGRRQAGCQLQAGRGWIQSQRGNGHATSHGKYSALHGKGFRAAGALA